jgi:hypothetical protein
MERELMNFDQTRTHRSVIFHSSAWRWKNWLSLRASVVRENIVPLGWMPGGPNKNTSSQHKILAACYFGMRHWTRSQLFN